MSKVNIDKDKLVEILEELTSVIYSVYLDISDDNSTYDPTAKLDRLIDRFKNEN